MNKETSNLIGFYKIVFRTVLRGTRKIYTSNDIETQPYFSNSFENAEHKFFQNYSHETRNPKHYSFKGLTPIK